MKPSIAIILCILILGVDSQRWVQFMKEAGQGRLQGWGLEVVFLSFKNLLEQGPHNQGQTCL
uniref:Serum amyloid A 3 n=1 Tax=Mus musculus TaxID=10090 RepID=A0A1B0GT10_MOUSE